MLDAFWHLAWYQENSGSPPRRVNYAALDVEELGSVYESLLEFHPAVDHNATGRPEFAHFRLRAQDHRLVLHAAALVNELIQSPSSRLSALVWQLVPTSRKRLCCPFVSAIRLCQATFSSRQPVGSARAGARPHRRGRARAEHVREATRSAVSHCIYGVDKNPLAVDLCRVALWLESHVGDKPLTYLDHRIRCGDSLVGVFDLAGLKDGIPDKAFKPSKGDRVTARPRPS